MVQWRVDSDKPLLGLGVAYRILIRDKLVVHALPNAPATQLRLYGFYSIPYTVNRKRGNMAYWVTTKPEQEQSMPSR
ncbi:Hypothetical protein NGAL_HAMBI2605_20390 [Neorhizobium galegae bv. orientalis]|nr:Hypothetical protein NGAL_HAMBI2605_20390 [Neorhizobium galegae bv. orientalis]